MPETPTTYNYYPVLSGLMTADELPEILGFIRDGLQQIFEKVYYKNFYSSVSQDGSFPFYSLEIVSRTKLAVEFPGTGIFFVLNPDYEDITITSFPITLQWNQKNLRYLGRFSMDSGFRRKEEDKFLIADQRMEIDNILGYATRIGLSKARLRTISTGPDKISLSIEGGEFVLANRKNLQQVGGGISFANSLDAERYLIQQKELSPTTVEDWIIANRYELV